MSEERRAPELEPAPSGSNELSLCWRKTLAVLDVLAKLAVPLAVVVAGCYVEQSITRTQVGPAFTQLAIETLEQNPLAQPDGVREWAVDLLTTYGGVEPTQEMARRLESGWGFTSEIEYVGDLSIDLATPEGISATVDDQRVELVVDGREEGRIRGVRLSLPDAGHSVTEESMSSTEILRIHQGARAYLFRFEGFNGDVAELSAWRQLPRGVEVPHLGDELGPGASGESRGEPRGAAAAPDPK